MDTERWRHIERLYHAALERPPRERDVFLEAECRGDDDLRLEVQALLSRAASAEVFLDRPAADIAAEILSTAGDARPDRPAVRRVRGAGADRRRRHGCGLPGPRQKTESTRRDQVSGRRSRSPGRPPPLPTRSPHDLVPESPAHRDGARRGRVRGPAVPRHRTRRRRNAPGLAEREPQLARDDRVADGCGGRARRCARRRRVASRYQARKHPDCNKRVRQAG